MPFKRPMVPKPKIPKMKKPDISKSKKLNKTIKSEVSAKQISHKSEKKKTSLPEKKTTYTKKKIRTKHGICYDERNCKGKRLSKQCTKSQCNNLGGKSWKGKEGCENLKKSKSGEKIR